MAQWLEHSPGVREVESSIPRYGNIGLCASRQHILGLPLAYVGGML